MHQWRGGTKTGGLPTLRMCEETSRDIAIPNHMQIVFRHCPRCGIPITMHFHR